MLLDGDLFGAAVEPVVVGAEEGDGAGRFGLAVGVHEADVGWEDVDGGADHVVGHGRGAVGEDFEGVAPEVGEVVVLHGALEHGGDDH